MDTSEFDFALPPELIAQEPPQERGASRLLVMQRDRESVEDAMFADLQQYLRAGDLLVLNDSRVFPARLLGRRVPSGGAVECLLLRRLQASSDAAPEAGQSGAAGVHLGPAAPAAGSVLWDALMHPGQKLKPGARVLFERDGICLQGEVVGRHFHGRRSVRLWTGDGTDVDAAIEQIGHLPLPPYITRDDRPLDRERYQTVYACDSGSVAAPTAGLHFTRALLAALSAHGVEHTRITLHVGYGTFKPVRVDRVEDHVVDGEMFTVSPDTAHALTRARRENRRVIAVGTTTTRALESLPVGSDGSIAPAAGETRLFIRPGHEFRVVQGLVTNFHLPRSSLLMLVAALAGRDRVMAAYHHAVGARYRFYSYGDAMLVL